MLRRRASAARRFPARKCGEQIEALENEADLAVANVGQLIAVEPGNIDAIEQIAPAGRAIEAAEHVHHRRFSRAARAHDRDEFAALISSETPRTACTSTSPVR